MCLSYGGACAADSALAALAARSFSNLTRAERALLEYADASNTVRGDFAVAGPSATPDDPSNDPKNADEWGADRRVRASLIRWLCVNPQAVALVDSGGVRLLGARIDGPLDLSYARIPFALVLHHCAIPEHINLHSAETRQLNLNGSYTGEIDGEGIDVKGELFLGYGFHADGEVVLQDARVDGYIDCGAGHFHYSKVEPQVWGAGLHKALTLEAAQVRSDIYLWDGFESEGMIYLNDAVLGADLFISGARITNPGQVAVSAIGVEVNGNVFMGVRSVGENSAAAAPFQKISEGFQANGQVDFTSSRVAAGFVVTDGQFTGSPGASYGFSAPGLSVKSVFVWQRVRLAPGAQLNLAASSALAVVDDETSWPAPGLLNIDGLTYQGLVPADAGTRLRWIGLQAGFHPQPYRQLAKVLRETGDEPGAREVLIAADDARFHALGMPAAIWGGVLKWTIGYGHQPLLTVMWSLAVIALGWLMIWLGKRGQLMRRTWPENSPAPGDESYEELHPLLYSIDAFFPFVNLHQEHYWWPDSSASRELAILGRTVTLRGRALRYYLWFEIGAGWLLSAIFLAGVTGLLRND